MTKSRREQQLDRTRRVEWIYYALFIGGLLLAVKFQASATVLWGLMMLATVLGMSLHFWQYRTLDELAKIRFIKSLAVAGGITVYALALLLFWFMVRWSTGPIGQRLSGMEIPLMAVYAVLVLALVSASITHFYLRRQAERE